MWAGLGSGMEEAKAGHGCWPQGYKRMEANSCKGRHMGSSEACMSGVWAGEGILWRAEW